MKADSCAVVGRLKMAFDFFNCVNTVAINWVKVGVFDSDLCTVVYSHRPLTLYSIRVWRFCLTCVIKMATNINSSKDSSYGMSTKSPPHQQGQGSSFETLDKSSSNTLKVCHRCFIQVTTKLRCHNWQLSLFECGYALIISRGSAVKFIRHIFMCACLLWNPCILLKLPGHVILISIIIRCEYVLTFIFGLGV